MLGGMGSNDETLVLTTPRAIEAVTSPARAELLECFAGEDELSAADLAERLGRSTGSVYYHLRILEQIGVIVRAGERRRGRKDEALYRPASARIRVGPAPRSKAGVGAARKAAGVILRATARDLSAAIAEPDVRREGRDRECYALRAKAHLTRAELRQVNDHVDAILEVLQAARSRSRRGSGRPHAFLVALTPSRRGRKNKKETP